jgi:hypothetical protein
MPTDQYHLHPWKFPPYLGSQIHAIAVGHLHIGDDQVRDQKGDETKGLRSSTRFPRYLELLAVLQQGS